jgi:hypothetical protein
MLSYRLLDDCEGLMLIGDYSSLALLHEIAMDVDRRTPLLHNKDDGTALSALAYDIRKAYEHKREVISPPEDFSHMGTLYGVGIIWPSLLAQQRLLRMSLSYIDHGKRHQAITYALEAVVEDGLKEAFGDAAQNIMEQLDAMPPTDLVGMEDSFERFLAWDAAQRKRHLIDLLVPAWIKRES